MIDAQLATLPFSHVTAPDVPLSRVVDWLAAAAAAGWALPLGLARDLGLLLSQPVSTLQLGRADCLPAEVETASYLAFLQRLALYPLVQALARGQPALDDALLGVVIARLVQGLGLPARYRIPTGTEGAYFAHNLKQRLDSSDHDNQALVGQIWRETAQEKRVAWHELLPAEALAQIERNVRTLKHDELRFMARYGPPLGGSPDPRELLDLLALTNLPPAVGLALSQSLQLLPRLSELQLFGGVQRYPTGGYEGLTRKGNLDNLLPSELAYPQDIFLHRVLNSEALYYGRERPRTKERALAYIVVQSGLGLGEDGRLMARALLLALSELLGERGYEVQYSFAGSSLTLPASLRTRSDLSHLLYYRDKGLPKVKESLQGVLRHLTSIRDRYTVRHLLWVVSDYFDIDESAQHAPLYQALQAVAQQSAWYIHQGPSPHRANGSLRQPPTARHVGFWQSLDTALMWRHAPPRAPIVPFLPRSRPAWQRWKDQIEQYPFRDGVRNVLHFTHEAQLEAWQKLAHLDPSTGSGTGAEQAQVDDYLRTLAPPNMAYIPAGVFLMGWTEEEVKQILAEGEASGEIKRDWERERIESAQGQHEVWLSGYYMNCYPVTNAEYGAFMAADGYQNVDYWREAEALGWWKEGQYKARFEGWVSQPRYWDDKRRNGPQQPVVAISWHEALAYCRWKGMSLPTEAQWEKAAGWDAKKKRMRRYPWGDEDDKSKVLPISETHAEVGHFCNGELNFYGLSDMTGLYHWCRSKYQPYPSTVPEQRAELVEVPVEGRPDDGREELDGADRRVLRGYWDFRLVLSLCRSRYRNNPLINRNNDGGFRPVWPHALVLIAES